MPEEVQVDDAEASLQKVILELSLPKKKSVDTVKKYRHSLLFLGVLLIHAQRFNSLLVFYVHLLRCFLLHVFPEFLFRYAFL